MLPVASSKTSALSKCQYQVSSAGCVVSSMSMKPPSNSNRLVCVTGTFSEVSSAEVDERCSVDVDAPFPPRRRPAASTTAREEIEALVLTPGAKRAPAEMRQREGCADSSRQGSHCCVHGLISFLVVSSQWSVAERETQDGRRVLCLASRVRNGRVCRLASHVKIRHLTQYYVKSRDCARKFWRKPR